MPSHASANEQIKQLYVDGHFCYAYKIGIVTNGLGIVRRLENTDYKINQDGIPCCPKDETTPMKYECISKLRSGVPRYKFVCPKMIWEYNPETKKSGRMIYVLILVYFVALPSGILHTKFAPP